MTKVRTRRSPAGAYLKYTSLLTVWLARLGTMAAVIKRLACLSLPCTIGLGLGATISKATKLCQGLGVDFDTLWVVTPNR